MQEQWSLIDGPHDGLVKADKSAVVLYVLFSLLTNLASIYMWAGHTTHVFICAGMLLAVFRGPVGYVIFIGYPRKLRMLLTRED